MGAFFTAILAKFATLAGWLLALVVAIFAATWLLGTDLFAWLFEQLLDALIEILNAFQPDFTLFNPAQYINALPAEVVQMVGFLRVGEALAIIGAAIIIRIGLQLIPFTRLGS